MKSLLIALMTFATVSSAFADCRIAVSGIAQEHISKRLLLERGFQLVDENELNSGDYLASVELYQVDQRKNEITSNYRTHVSFEQVISKLDVSENKITYTAVKADEIKVTFNGYINDSAVSDNDSNLIAIGKERILKIPRCSKLKK